MNPEYYMESNNPVEYLKPAGSCITRETSFPVSPAELDIIRKQITIRPDGKFPLSGSGSYHDRLRSYLATELLGKVDNPATEIHPGEIVDAWVGQRIGVARSAEEGFMMDAKQGSGFWDKAKLELGEDAIPLIKSIYRNGINYPVSNGEHRDLYIKSVGFLGRCIQDLSFRQGSEVRLSNSAQEYREKTWRLLDDSKDVGIIIPSSVNQAEPARAKVVLPEVRERRDSPWEKIKSYSTFLDSLSSRDREGLELVAGITPLGIRKVFAPALQQARP